jgi:putative ABC transport system ATP-binding protein
VATPERETDPRLRRLRPEPSPTAPTPPAPLPLPGSPAAAARAVLVLPDGTQFPINREEFVIGRSSSSDLALDDTNVSRRHARLELKDGSFFLSDLGSANGTFVNGVRVKERSAVRDQDHLKIGRVTVVLRVYGAGGASAPDFPRPMVVQARNLTKVYGSGPTKVVAVNGVSLEVPGGRIELIMGPSGSGKTTLLSMLGCLLRPSSGSLKINSQEVTRQPDRALAQLRLRQVGFIFQGFNLLSSLPVLENVIFPLGLAGVRRGRAATRARELLGRLDLGDRLDYPPAKLSHGEQQRVAIARALINEPSLILADEPTANLDSKSGHSVMEMLYRIAKEQDRTVIIASHDPRIKDIADRILWLEDGQLSLGDRSYV